MAKGLSPTQRTLRAQRQQGRICAVVEKWIQYPAKVRAKLNIPGVRKDLFGWIDVVALDPERGIVGIQSCGQAFSEHLHKLLDSDCTENIIEWLRCGGHAELWGWRKLKLRRGGKAMRWQPRVRVLTLADFIPENTEE